jgi:hypothetical protein
MAQCIIGLLLGILLLQLLPRYEGAGNLLGREPKVGFESGLRETIAYFCTKAKI